MEKEVNNIKSDQLQHLMSGVKEKAGENLKYRIMQQIATEQALSRKTQKQASSVTKTVFPILAVMYVLVFAVILGVYLLHGLEGLLSASVYMPILAVSSICGFYMLISTFDEKRHQNKGKQNKS